MKQVFSLMTLSLFVFTAAKSQSPEERLENSPRHHEWVDVTYQDRTVKAFLVYPEVSEKVPVVIVIHENRGLNDWARSMADQLAEAGYIAIAPDLLSGEGPDGGGTSSFESSDAARTGIYNLDQEQVTADLKATIEYSKKNIPAANGKVAVIGFCWGGSQAFRLSTNTDEVEAFFVCYGTGPKEMEAYQEVSAPVYGFYGGNDNRVNATIERSKEAMEKYNKTYRPVIYEGAGHGFFRAGESPDASEANKKARKEGWERLKKLLGMI
ncbi:MAG: dienelactone hydrolase family protein [Fulvivirga sp.]|nr:dienelactone hydrolase family protein [Fulvivirga sp.]